jgi:SAM-dependent methyltransferase
MESFWDARAREDAYYFVDTRLEYGNPDEKAFWSGGEAALDQLLDVLGAEIEPQHRVVDLGCGIGRLTRALAGRAEDVVGIDVSGEMLARARELNSHLSNVEWLQGDGRSLAPVADSSVDVCVSHVVFRHIPDPAISLGYVREIGRVLRPGGFAVIEFSNDPHEHEAPVRRPWTAIVARFRRAPRVGGNAAWVGSYIDLADLRDAAGSAGLHMDRVAGEGTQYCAALLRAPG